MYPSIHPFPVSIVPFLSVSEDKFGNSVGRSVQGFNSNIKMDTWEQRGCALYSALKVMLSIHNLRLTVSFLGGPEKKPVLFLGEELRQSIVTWPDSMSLGHRFFSPSGLCLSLISTHNPDLSVARIAGLVDICNVFVDLISFVYP